MDLPSPSFRWVELERHSANPVLRTVPNTWEAIWFVVDAVIEVGGEYRMYYSAAIASDKKKSQLGLAVSRDGVLWERHKANPIWQNAWHHFLRDVRVCRFGPSDFWLYYSDGDRHLDLARSTDGIRWTNDARNPILTPFARPCCAPGESRPRRDRCQVAESPRNNGYNFPNASTTFFAGRLNGPE